MAMSGPPGLSTLLIKRLDAALGTTLSQHARLVSGARPDAVAQPGGAARPQPLENQAGRHPQEAADKALQQAGQQVRQAVEQGKLDAQRLLAPGRPPPDASGTPSAPTTLGRAARSILALLTLYPDQAPALAGRRPLLPSPPSSPLPGSPDRWNASSVDLRAPPAAAPSTAAATPGAAAAAPPSAAAMAPALAQALTQALQHSGLFYESHLADMAFGTRRADALRQEPQAPLAQTGMERPGAAAAGAPPAGPSSERGPHPPPADSLPAAPDAAAPKAAPQGHGPAASAGQPAAAGALAGLHPDTHLLVRQQLEVLAGQAIQWQGEAWPGTPLRWEVLREDDARADSAEQAGHWATRLTLSLPRLGTVQARIVLAGQQVAMQLAAPDSRDELALHDESLRMKFAAAGLSLSQLSIADQPLPDAPPMSSGEREDGEDSHAA